MVKVCIHYPLNPEWARMCMNLMGHAEVDTTELVLPFSDDPNQIRQALRNLMSDGYISDDVRQELIITYKD